MGVWAMLMQGFSFILLQVDPLQEQPPQGVEIPIFPVLVALLGIVAIVMVSMGALKTMRLPFKPRARPAKEPKAERAKPPPKPTLVVEAPEPAPVAPIFQKAPIEIVFPMIKAPYPDVWGVGEKAVIVFRAEDSGLVSQRDIPGLTAFLGSTSMPLVFFRGEARVERTFATRGEVPITVELKVRGEHLQRKTTRVLNVVDYREEIADMFAQFKDESSQTITPLRHDATAWEIYDALLDANPRLSQVALREVVSSFEEAKFSNHAVGRPTFEKMFQALRALRKSEA